MAQNFIFNQNSNKVILNIADQFATNNNCGFNLANFKRRFIDNYFEDVVMDYERSYIGSFSSALFDALDQTDVFELYFTISKFEGNMGYSLTENLHGENGERKSDIPLYDDGALGGTKDLGVSPKLPNDKKQNSDEKRRAIQNSAERLKDENFKRETIPEFVLVKDIQSVYRIFCEANKKNKILLRSQLGEEYFQNEEKKKALFLQNIKDDIILVQFKLVRKDTGKIHNVQTFINVPVSK